MKKLISFLTLLSYFVACDPFPTPAIGALTEPDIAHLVAKNIVFNPGFEEGSAGWTASGGATKAANATAKLSGNLGFDWDSNAAGQTLTGKAITIPAGLKGHNAVVSCNVYTVSGTATHTLAAYDGTTAYNPQTINSVAGTSQRTIVNFIMPSSGTIAPQLKSVASNEPEAYIDDCFIADAALVNLGSSQLNTQWAADSNFTTSSITGQGTITNMVAKSRRNGPDLMVHLTYTAGVAAASGWTIVIPSAYTINSAAFGTVSQKVGEIKQLETASAQFPSVSEGPWAIFYDGSTTNTLFVAGHTSSNVYTKDNGNQGNSSIPTDVQFAIPITQFTDQSVYSPATTPASWGGYINGASWSTTSTTLADPTVSGTPAINENFNRNFGTVSLASSNRPGVTGTPPRTGRYWVCASVIASNSTASKQSYYSLLDATNSFKIATGTFYSAANAGLQSTLRLCGVDNIPAVAATTFTVQAATDSGGTTNLNNPSTSLVNAVEISIFELDASMPTSFLTQSVSSTTTGSEHLERAAITNNGTTATISSQSGTWLTSATRTGAGKVSFVIAAAEFSAAPTCWCNANVNSGTIAGNCFQDSTVSVTPTAFGVADQNTTTGGTQDQNFNVFCMGPR